MRIVLVVLLVLLLVGALPLWPYSSGLGLGYGPSGLLGLVLVVIIILAVLGRI